MSRPGSIVRAAVISALLLFACPPAALSSAQWVGAWAASPSDDGLLGPKLVHQTVREVIRPTIGARMVRVTLSNRHGRAPVTIRAAAIGRRLAGPRLVAGTNHALTWAGARSVVLPPGEDRASDPAPLEFDAFQDLAVSIHVAGVVRAASEHFVTNTTSYLSNAGTGDTTMDDSGAPYGQRTTGLFSNGWLYLARVDVLVPPGRRAVVAFGDSLTDGFQGVRGRPLLESSAGLDAHAAWPERLAARLAAASPSGAPSVLNAGIGGNRLLRGPDFPAPSGAAGLERLDVDVLDLPGVTDVIALLGINDLARGATPAEVIAGLAAIIRRGHARGVRVHVGTLTPSRGHFAPGADYGSAATDAKRMQVNDWIRRAAPGDSVVDFDAAVRGRSNPARLRPEFDSGDHLHPNARGYAAMAGAARLAALSSPAGPAR